MEDIDVAPIVLLARRLYPDMYLCSEVADALEVSPATLRRLARLDPRAVGPTLVTRVRGVSLWLYDMQRVEILARELAAKRAPGGCRVGRPRLWEPAVRRQRRSQHSAASYYRRRAAILSDRGDVVAAAFAEQRAREISEVLRSELRLRNCLIKGGAS